MANTVEISGTLVAGPQAVCDSAFPSGSLELKFGVGPCGCKPAAVQCYNTKNVNAPSVYVALDGIGTGESVTQANTLYVRAPTPLNLRLTTDDGAGGSVVAIVPISGVWVMEFPSNKFLKLLEVLGVGPIEYYASGNS